MSINKVIGGIAIALAVVAAPAAGYYAHTQDQAMSKANRAAVAEHNRIVAEDYKAEQARVDAAQADYDRAVDEYCKSGPIGRENLARFVELCPTGVIR